MVEKDLQEISKIIANSDINDSTCVEMKEFEISGFFKKRLMWEKSVRSWWFAMSSEERPKVFTKEDVGVVLGLTAPLSLAAQTSIGRLLLRIGFRKKRMTGGGRRSWVHEPTDVLLYRTETPLVLGAPIPSHEGRFRLVYFIQSVRGGPINIGSSSNVLHQLKRMQPGSPFRLRLLVVIPFSVATEDQVFEKCAHLRIPDSSWFHPEQELLDFLDERIIELCLSRASDDQ